MNVHLALSVCLTVAFGVSSFEQIAVPAPDGRANARAITPQSVVRLTNASRAAAGLPALQVSEALETSATLKNAEMRSLGYFGHYSPKRGSPWRFFKRAGYDYKAAAENLSKGQTNVEALQFSWMNSKHHRQNILGRQYTEIGVSVNRDVVVVHFGAR